MNNFARLGVGILGSAIALLMYGAPITTFMKVIQMRSTESFSGFPYAIALYNCILYTWYVSPLISNGWHNIVVMVVNAVGILLECCFICIYLTFAPPKPKRKMVGMVIGVLMVFGTLAINSFLAVHDHNKRKAVIGTAGIVETVILYASPLSIVRMVIQTNSVEFMSSFYFSFFAFLGSVLWMVYGALSKDIIIMRKMVGMVIGVLMVFGTISITSFLVVHDHKERKAVVGTAGIVATVILYTSPLSVIAPKFLYVPLGLAQMVLLCVYRAKKSQHVENEKMDGCKQRDFMKERSDVEEPKCPLDDQDIEMQLNV